jgi:hypothetical protein
MYDIEGTETLDIDSKRRRINNSTARLLLQRHTNQTMPMPGYNDAVEIDEVDLRKDLPINITMKGFKLNKNQQFRPFSGSRLA